MSGRMGAVADKQTNGVKRWTKRVGKGEEVKLRN